MQKIKKLSKILNVKSGQRRLKLNIKYILMKLKQGTEKEFKNLEKATRKVTKNFWNKMEKNIRRL